MSAMFKHVKSGGLYTVVARAIASLSVGVKLTDMQEVGVRKPDLGGHIAVQYATGSDTKATMQGEAENGVECILYRGTDGRLWLRSRLEFTDGRFEPLNPQAASMMPVSYHLFGSPKQEPQAA